MASSRRFPRHIALPQDHGSWAFLLTPLVLGAVAGGRLRVPSIYLAVAALAGFLLRQPLAVLVKVASGRRPGRERGPALRFAAVYAAIAALHVTGLVLRGYGYVLWLALPAAPVAAWHFALVARRAERRQPLVEVLAAGALALAAPGAMWVGRGAPDPAGWALWGLLWAQAAASILLVHVFLRWRDRGGAVPAAGERWISGGPALALSAVALGAALLLGGAGIVPRGIAAAHGVDLAFVAAGLVRPPRPLKPRRIGWRQAAATATFAAAFAAGWLAG
ncbi:MAG: hypothetical protein D6718_01015 [Acidobacteria bacterium]|nr:MAG: hypothetical protein D6718_01015 [Acidobacteriota bacterium]